MNAPTKRLGQVEFIALMAMVVATVAFAIDAMLPALPRIGQDISPTHLNRVQLIVTSFVLGMGLGTFITGPLSDSFGRRPVIVGGAVVYCAAAAVAAMSQSLEVMLAARVVQGIGAAGPRVATMAMIRDLYGGREMARISSYVLLVFSLIPALAPTLGYYIVAAFGWRMVFASFIVFSILSTTWLLLRQPETLAPQNQRPVRVNSILAATREVFAIPTVRLSIIIQTLTLGTLFITLSVTQQVFDVTFGRGDQFHLWFGGIAVVASSASLLNARFVVRLGMRAIIKGMFTAQIVLSLLMIAVTLFDGPDWLSFGAYVLWTLGLFYQAGLTIGNLNALAMEPVGHIAGVAASIITATSTVGAAFIAAPIGLTFNGTPLPMAVAVLICAVLALWLTTKIRRPSDDAP